MYITSTNLRCELFCISALKSIVSPGTYPVLSILNMADIGPVLQQRQQRNLRVVTFQGALKIRVHYEKRRVLAPCFFFTSLLSKTINPISLKINGASPHSLVGPHISWTCYPDLIASFWNHSIIVYLKKYIQIINFICKTASSLQQASKVHSFSDLSVLNEPRHEKT